MFHVQQHSRVSFTQYIRWPHGTKRVQQTKLPGCRRTHPLALLVLPLLVPLLLLLQLLLVVPPPRPPPPLLLLLLATATLMALLLLLLVLL